MRYPQRTTVCVSSQAGCAMGCGFCATGQAGLPAPPQRRRDRRAGDGGGPPRPAPAPRQRRADGDGRAARQLRRGVAGPAPPPPDVGIGARHLTVSTVGLVPGIRRLAAEPEPVNLAVSLHAADDELRDRLVPINRRHPLDELLAACADYRRAKGRRLSASSGRSSTASTTRPATPNELAAAARPLRAHVNLIPLNPTPGWPAQGTPAARRRRLRPPPAAPRRQRHRAAQPGRPTSPPPAGSWRPSARSPSGQPRARRTGAQRSARRRLAAAPRGLPPCHRIRAGRTRRRSEVLPH